VFAVLVLSALAFFGVPVAVVLSFVALLRGKNVSKHKLGSVVKGMGSWM
jgi:hypothetical protein